MVEGSNTHPSPIIKEPTMDKFTRKSSFEQWISPINFKKILKKFQKNRNFKIRSLYKKARHMIFYKAVIVFSVN